MRLTHLVRPPLPPTAPAPLPVFGVRPAGRPAAPLFAAAAGDVPLHDPQLKPRDEAVFLLHAASEVEHALMVQYLYAAYSLREGYPGADKPAELDEWRTHLLQIAREEMAHLISVQNLLHLVGGPLNFEREDFPFRSAIYPFHFQLEPLTKGSLAKYVYAEMPGTLTSGPLAGDIAEIKQRAEAANGGAPLNHVGWLYARLLALFQELPDEAFRVESVHHWARQADWSRGPVALRPRLLIGPEVPDPVTPDLLRAAALSVLHGIAQQGEGDGDLDDSHYRLFRRIYDTFHFREEDLQELFPGWMVPAQLNPNTISLLEVPDDLQLPPELRAGRIQDPRTRAWAQLFNQRYRLLLGYLEHSLSATLELEWMQPGAAPAARALLRGRCFGEMARLRELAQRLGELPAPSGAPFELPYTLSLPARDRDRWLSHLDVLQSAGRLAEGLLQGSSEPESSFLQDLLDADAVTADTLRNAAGGTLPAPPASTLERMIELIARKVRDDHAANFHAGIKLDGATPLSTLFDTSLPGNAHFELLLDALTHGNSVRAQPGAPLVVPGKPTESVLFRILAEQLIPFMASKFSAADQAVVRDWIADLPAPPSGRLCFATDIRPLFRAMDIQSMRDISGFDLSSYDDVKRLAPGILTRLEDGSMPCDGAWPVADIARFKQWVDDGMEP